MYYSLECGNICDYAEMIKQCRQFHEFVMNATDNRAWTLYFVKIS